MSGVKQGLVIRRECDVPMARSKKLLPCDRDCKNCMACIETTNMGERRHCTRHKTNFALDMRIAAVGMEPEAQEKPMHTNRQWTEMETKRLFFLKEQEGLTWRQIGERMHRSFASVQRRYQQMKAKGGN